MKISGGNNPKIDSEIKNIINITNGEHVSTILFNKSPISKINVSTRNKTKIKITAIIRPLNAVLLIKS